MNAKSPARRPTVVVDLSRGSVKIAAAEVAGEAVRFRGITRIPLPSAEGERGEPDVAELARSIGEEVQRHGWRGMRAAGLLSGSSTSTQSFLFPSMPARELREALTLKMAETLHFDLDESCFGYRPIRMLESDGKKQLLVLAAAARRDATERAVAVLREAGLQPVGIGTSAESLANLAYYARLCRPNEAVIHVDIGSSSTILNHFEGSRLRLSREIDVAGAAFTRALMRPIVTPRGALHLGYEQAEEVKLACGYPRDDQDIELPHGIRSSEILPLLDPVAQRLTSEIRRSTEYLCGILERLRVDRIVLSGAGGQMRNLATVLEEGLGTPVRFIDPVARAKAHWRLAICDDAPPPLAGFSAILGYSLGNRAPINLLPREARALQVSRGVAHVRAGVAPAAIALGICLAAAAVPIQGVYRATGLAMRQSLDELDERLREQSNAAEKRERLRQTAEKMLEVRGPVPDWIGLLKELGVLLPAEARITTLSVERTDAVLTARIEASIGPSNVPFESTVSELSSALAGSPFFRNVHVVDAQRSGSGSEGRLRATLEVVAGRDHRWEAQP